MKALQRIRPATWGLTMKRPRFPLGALFICFALVCLFTFQAYARQVTCPRCGGKGVIPGPVLNGLPSVYGCPDCGGSGGGGVGGSPGRGYIEVPDEPQANPQGNQPDNAEVARQAAEAERQRAIEEQRQKQAEADARRQAEFEKNKNEALSSMKGIADSEFGGLKGVSTEDNSGLKGLDDTKTLFSKPTPGDAPVDTRVKGPSKLDIGGPGSTQPVDASVVDLRHHDPNQPTAVDHQKEFDDAFAALCGKYGVKMEQEHELPLFFDWEVKEQSDPAFRRELESLRDKYARAAALSARGQADEKRHDAILHDPVFNRECDRIQKEKDDALNKADEKILEESNNIFESLCKKYGVKMEQEHKVPFFFDWETKEQIDPAFKQDLEFLRSKYRIRKDAAEKEIRDRYFQAILEQVEKCNQRLSEKERAAASQLQTQP